MDKQKIVIDELEMLRVLWSKILLIIIGGVMGAVIAFAITWIFIAPSYQSTASFYVNNKIQQNNGGTQYYSTGELSAAQSLVDTYIVILTQSPTLEKVIDVYDLSYSPEQLSEMISAKAINETEIFAVTVTAPTAVEDQTIVNGIADVFPEAISNVVEGASVQVVARGKLNPNPVSPSYYKNTLLGFLLGLIFVSLVILVKYYTDNKVHDEQFVNKVPGEYPLLARIPDLLSTSGKKKKGYGYGYGYEEVNERKDKFKGMLKGEARLLCGNVGFNASENYKLLRTNILYALPDIEGCTVIGLTSSLRGEAKSTTAINLAYTFAETGKRVLLIEGDMRLPVIANRLHLNPAPGLSNILGKFSEINEVFQSSKIRNNWYVITSGDLPPNPAELLESNQMKKAMEIFRKSFDYVIIDLPPVNVVSDALALSSRLDGLVLVVREEYTDIPSVIDAVTRIDFSESNFLGYVLTNSSNVNKTRYRRVGFNGMRRGYGKSNGRKANELS